MLIIYNDHAAQNYFEIDTVIGQVVAILMY